ncbi:MAG: NAD-dependent deacylase [Elusimicrobiaceae bacterium]|nr:NAD-dependent deacylase [Elusimicrobiaceae bacterium]
MKEIIDLIKNAKCLTAFTGAGISVESGIPPFRGAGGLWEKYDPKYIEIEFFYSHPKESWAEMKKIFFNSMGVAKPNTAHKTLAKLEEMGFLKGIITQNIDNLHQKAGNKKVLEYHGTIDTLVCTKCSKKYKTKDTDLTPDLPSCSCGGILKPDFVFYGEGINPQVYQESLALALKTDVMFVVGTSGEVMPACSLPMAAKQQNGAVIIEINTLPSAYTASLSDYYFEQKAGDFFGEIAKRIG